MASPYFSSNDLGVRTFYNGDGTVFLKEAIKVIDVSTWQYKIDWAKVATTDVDAAILRMGWGAGGIDNRFEENVDGCDENSIPFGVYLYSYAYDADYAKLEGQFVAATLDAYGFDKSIPFFYDVEWWNSSDSSGRRYWKGSDGTIHYQPTTVDEYKAIVEACFAELRAAGYTALYIYSGPYFVQPYLNDSSIKKYVAWYAQYLEKLQLDAIGLKYETAENERAWQYTSSGSVNGISTNVDMNAFSLFPYFAARLEACESVRLMNTYGFLDVNSSTPHQVDITWLVKNGISTGFDNGNSTRSFRPYSKIARCDMAAFLYRLAGSPDFDPASSSRTFSDVSSETPHYKDVMWLAGTGISTGFQDGTFRPYASIARCDMAAFLHRQSEAGLVPNYAADDEDAAAALEGQSDIAL